MYNRFIHVQNEFNELRETLSNGKVIGKFLRVIIRKLRLKDDIRGANHFHVERGIYLLEVF
jgi:hypothetical protein